MVGRATFGRPWIFRELQGGTLTTDEKVDILKQQVLTSVERIDEYRGILHVRRHLAASPVFKGITNFRETRIRMLRAATVEELFAIIEETRTLLHTLPAPPTHTSTTPNDNDNEPTGF